MDGGWFKVRLSEKKVRKIFIQLIRTIIYIKVSFDIVVSKESNITNLFEMKKC